MISKIVFLALFLGSVATLAQSAVDTDADTTHDKYSAAYNDLGNKLGKATIQIDNIRKDKEKLIQEVAQAQTDFDTAYNEDKHNKRVALKKALDAKTDELDQLNHTLQNASGELTRVNEEYKRVNTQKGKDEYYYHKLIGYLDIELKTADATTKINDLRWNLNNAQRTIDRIEMAYDNALIGGYVQRKIGEVLNSKALCTAIASCSSGHATANGDALKEIFKDLQDTKYGAPTKAAPTVK